MANTDEDWKKFLSATEEDDEEVETPEEDEPENPDDDADDSGESEEDEDEGSDEDESDEDDSEEKGKNEKPAKTYKPRLKQFLNEDGSLNTEKLETSYIESGKQAVKLDGQVKELTGKIDKTQSDYSALLEAIKAKPDIAKALFGEEGAKRLAESETPGKQTSKQTDPLLRHLEAQMNNASQREYNDFAEQHPEITTDPEKARKVGSYLKIFGANYREEHDGEIPSMKEALESAYRFHGWDLKIKKKEDVASAAKKAAATRSSGTAKRSAKSKDTTMGEEFFAKKLGVKLTKK